MILLTLGSYFVTMPYYKTIAQKKLDKKKKADTKLIKLIKTIHAKYIFYGHRRITKQLRRDGYKVNKKRVIRLMRQANIKAIYPKPKTTIANKQHKKYPYLLQRILTPLFPFFCMKSYFFMSNLVTTF